VKDEKPKFGNHSRVKCDKCKYEKRKARHRRHNSLPRRKAAEIARQLRNNDKSREGASLLFRRWDVVDESWLLDNAINYTDKELAEKLGRTIRGVNTKLYKLRKAERERSCV
jgi:transcription initiation factor IIE alpha subunit